MKIALFGYGKMGKVIKAIAEERRHQIALIVDENTDTYSLEEIDVAIEFSVPEAAFDNIKRCFASHVPVVCGTTGWLERYDECLELCKRYDGAFIYASNFSLGVNLFFEMNRYIAKMMNSFKNYIPHIEEVHHTEKKDAPSGTAISLAESIMNQSSYTDWQLSEHTEADRLGIAAKRIPDTPGTHTITYSSDVDTISIRHVAHNRLGFGLGAVIAAEWLKGKKGVYSMRDVLNIG